MADNTVFRTRIEHQSAPGTDKEAGLIMIEGDFLGEVYDLKKDLTLISRTDDVDIVLSDVDASRRHVRRITSQPSGYFVSDVGSTNGTRVNNQPLMAPRLLHDGNKIRISDTIFKCSYQDADDTEYHPQLPALAVKVTLMLWIHYDNR